MRRLVELGLAAAVSLAVVLTMASTPASAVDPTGDPATPSVFGDDGGFAEGVAYGGTTQSVDPTAYDYVPPSPPAGVQLFGASGMASVGGFQVTIQGQKITVPGFWMEHVIQGKGYSVTKEWAQYAPVSYLTLCNYQTAFQNRSGSTIYATRWSAYHSGCSTGIFVQNAPGSFQVREGQECARLYVAGVFRGEQCHYVHK